MDKAEYDQTLNGVQEKKSQVSKSPPAPAVFGNDAAPFVYFDLTHAVGELNGAIQLELCANTLVTTGDGQPPKLKPIVQAHLRCTVAAAAQLRDAINIAIGFKPDEPPATSN